VARTIEFGEDPKDRRIIDEDGTAVPAPAELETTELAIIEKAPKVTKTQARAAANMRYAGHSYDAIARFFDYKDAATARRVVDDAIARAFPDESRDSLFRLANARYQRLMAKLDERTDAFIPRRDENGKVLLDPRTGKPELEANPEQIAYVKTVADLNARWVRLNGLEAPQQLQITPDAKAFDEVVAQMRDAALAGQAPEADIFADIEDAELVDEPEPENGELDG
jgi:hypothetical protein